MLDFVGNGEYFELYSLNHRKPMKGAKDGGDVVRFLSARDETSCSVLDSLKGGNMSLGEIDVDEITSTQTSP